MYGVSGLGYLAFVVYGYRAAGDRFLIIGWTFVVAAAGVVMVVYLHEALDRRLRQGGAITPDDLRAATMSGSVLRLRPKLMTVSAVMAGLVPIMWSTGVGSDIMKPIAAPIIGGMITSTVHVLIVTPVIFYIMKLRALKKGTLTVSGMLP